MWETSYVGAPWGKILCVFFHKRLISNEFTFVPVKIFSFTSLDIFCWWVDVQDWNASAINRKVRGLPQKPSIVKVLKNLSEGKWWSWNQEMRIMMVCQKMIVAVQQEPSLSPVQDQPEDLSIKKVNNININTTTNTNLEPKPNLFNHHDDLD